MKYKFQKFIDISTSADTMQIINFSVGGMDVIQRCAHLFNAYKYFKLGNISVKFVPASTLPVDPLGLSYSADDPQTVDPRDQLNAGLVRITNGEDLFDDLTGVSATAQEQMYNAMLLDPRWYKFSLQSGFKRTAKPLYWQIGQVHQDTWPGANINMPAYGLDSDNIAKMATQSIHFYSPSTTAASGEVDLTAVLNRPDSSEYGIFQTGHRGRLGYLPTDFYQNIGGTERAGVHPAPSVQVITCVLPKMHKTNYFYRVYITETVYFSGLRSIAPGQVVNGVLSDRYRGIDNFMVSPNVWTLPPTSTSVIGFNPPVKNMNDGEQ